MPSNPFKYQPLHEEHIIQRMKEINALEALTYSGGAAPSARGGCIAETHLGDILVGFVEMNNSQKGRVQNFDPTTLAYNSHFIDSGTASSALNATFVPAFPEFRVVGSSLYTMSTPFSGGDTTLRLKKFSDSGSYTSSWGLSSSGIGAGYGRIDGSLNYYEVIVTSGLSQLAGAGITKYDSSGSSSASATILSAEAKGGGNDLYGTGIGMVIVDNSGNLYVLGYTLTSPPHLYVIKRSASTLAHVSVVSTGLNINTVDLLISVGASSGKLIFATFGDNKFYTSTNFSSCTTINVKAHDVIYGVIEASSGDFFLTVDNSTGERTGGRYYLVRLNSSGVEQGYVALTSTAGSGGLVVPAQTVWYAYQDTTKASLGTPDGGVASPALTGLSANSAKLSTKHILDMRVAIQALVASNHFKNPSTGVLYNWTNGNANNLYYVAMGARTNYGATGGAAYDWTRDAAGMLSDPKTYDLDIGEIRELNSTLLAATVV